MPLVSLTELFKFSPDGIQIIEYEAGEHDLEGRALEVADSMGIIDDSMQRAAAAQVAADAKAAEDAAAVQVAADAKAAEKPASKK
jgi:hypothetical protein